MAAATPPPPSAPAALQVATVHLETATIDRFYRTSGTLKAIREAEIVATQPGLIRSISVDEGDRVKVGQTLVRLDGRLLALEAAAASLQAENLAYELERLEGVAAGVIPREEIDKQRYAVAEARALAKRSGAQARETIVRAPFTGTIVARLVDEGHLATTASPLLRIADLGALELELHLPERDATTISRETEVELELLDGEKFRANIERRAPVVDPVTGTVKFTARADAFPEHAMPGAFVRAKLLLERQSGASTLPREAVFELDGTSYVYTIVDGHTSRVRVELGIAGSERVAILSGLDADDPVVRDGNVGITDGMLVRVAPAE